MPTKIAGVPPSIGSINIYDVDADTSASGTVPTLTAGTIEQTNPTAGIPLTFSGSNVTQYGSIQWKEGPDGGPYTDILGETSATLSSAPEGFVVVEVRALNDAQPPATSPQAEVTAGVTVAASLFGSSTGWLVEPQGQFWTDETTDTVATDADDVGRWENQVGDDLTQAVLADRPVLDSTTATTSVVGPGEFDCPAAIVPETEGTMAFRGRNGLYQIFSIGPNSEKLQMFAAINEFQFRIGDDVDIYQDAAGFRTDDTEHTVVVRWDDAAGDLRMNFGFYDIGPGGILRNYTGTVLTGEPFKVMIGDGRAFAAMYINRQLTDQEVADLITEWEGYTFA